MKAFVSVIAIAFCFGGARSETADSTLMFADHLYAQGDYARAITFYKKAAFEHQEDSVYVAGTMFGIGRCHMQGGEHEPAMVQFSAIINRYPKLPVATLSKFQIGMSKFHAQLYAAAALDFSTFEKEHPEHAYAPHALFYESLSHLGEFQWEKSKQGMLELKKKHPRAEVSVLADSLEPLLGRGLELPRKSAALATALSAVVPGSGQFYCDRYKDAISIFIIEGLMGFAAYYAFANDAVSNTYGYAWSSLFGIFHLSNIYGAINAAGNANKIISHNQRESVTRKIRLMLSNQKTCKLPE